MYGCSGSRQDRLDRPELDGAPAVDDEHLVGDLPDDRQVVRDEDVRQMKLAPQVGEQVEDLCLDRDVERRDGLVEDEDLGLGGQGAGDRGPLALAAGQLPREGARFLLAEPDRVEELEGARRALRLASREVDALHLVERPADALVRVERRVRILEDDLDDAAALEPLRPARPAGQLPALEHHAPRRRLLQADEHPRDGRLAGARLADDAQRTARIELEGDATDRVHLGARS